ncbi:uncharacterized protein LOC101223078 isoform X2 [Cucumis sativus]|uniref:uncharacterized protein LOC101223078 isoform X2 n=1 Tax=Cucumis sativus TaxID=3659 RepID=UPI0005EC415B|nr:uncharacterized protein LOC101223078 isoform X2 [Cucumis sativus]KAE8652588.1 hypothetical protein Csa_014170 [Cucumis sativus]
MGSPVEEEAINPLTDEIKDSGVENFDDGSKEMFEKRSETRERKKSKYLSFPYINWGRKVMPAETEDIKFLKISGEGEDENAVEGQNETPSLSKCSGRFWKKWYRNITSGSDVPDNQDLMSASPAEFLSELHFTAVNCLYPNDNNNFDAVAQFFSRFRILMFHDESVNGGQNEAMAADLFFLGGKASEVKHPSSAVKSGIKKRKNQASSIMKMEDTKSKQVSGDVDLTGKAETSPAGDADEESPPSSNVESDKDRESLWREFVDNQDLMSGSPAEFLSELHFTAVDCLYPNVNNNFGTVAQFFSIFRILMFLGEKVSEDKQQQQPSSAAKSGIRKRKGQSSSIKKMEEMKSKPVSGDVDLTGNAEISPAGDAQKKTPSTSKVKSKKDKESLGRLKTKSLSALSDVNITLSSCSLLAKDSPEAGPLSPNGLPKRRKRRNNGVHPQSKPTTEIPDLNGSGAVAGLLVEDQQAVSHVAAQLKREPKRRRKRGVSKENSKASTEFINVNVNDSNKPGAPNQSVNDQTIGQDQSKSGGKKRKRKEKPPLADPDAVLSYSNGVGTDTSQGKDSQLTNNLPPQPKPKRRRRRKGQASLNHPNPSDSRSYIYNRVETDGEGLGSLLLLTFSSEAPLPPREQVITTFSQFGSLKESEIQLKDSTVEIVFLRSADAMEAVRSLKKNNIFGPTLLKYQLYHLSAPPKTSDSDRACTALAYPASEGTLNPSKSAESGNQAGDAPPIEFIRKNLQMMTSMLEKSGDNLSPDMRAKLECDIEGLLKKVSSMAGPSST